jgi:hypothetical protein
MYFSQPLQLKTSGDLLTHPITQRVLPLRYLYSAQGVKFFSVA